jgi:hypothetical protein
MLGPTVTSFRKGQKVRRVRCGKPFCIFGTVFQRSSFLQTGSDKGQPTRDKRGARLPSGNCICTQSTVQKILQETELQDMKIRQSLCHWRMLALSCMLGFSDDVKQPQKKKQKDTVSYQQEGIPQIRLDSCRPLCGRVAPGRRHEYGEALPVQDTMQTIGNTKKHVRRRCAYTASAALRRDGNRLPRM